MLAPDKKQKSGIRVSMTKEVFDAHLISRFNAGKAQGRMEPDAFPAGCDPSCLKGIHTWSGPLQSACIRCGFLENNYAQVVSPPRPIPPRPHSFNGA